MLFIGWQVTYARIPPHSLANYAGAASVQAWSLGRGEYCDALLAWTIWIAICCRCCDTGHTSKRPLWTALKKYGDFDAVPFCTTLLMAASLSRSRTRTTLVLHRERFSSATGVSCATHGPLQVTFLLSACQLSSHVVHHSRNNCSTTVTAL